MERKQKEKYEKAEEKSMKRLRFKHWKDDRPFQERQQKHSRKHKEKVIKKRVSPFHLNLSQSGTSDLAT